jgi:hypothetical protein
MEAFVKGLLWFFGLAVTFPIWLPIVAFLAFASLFSA